MTLNTIACRTFSASCLIDELFELRQSGTYKPRLLRVQMVAHHKGKRVPIVREVALTSKSLNSKETFIYDGGLTLLIWHGREVTSHEKIAVRPRPFGAHSHTGLVNR